MLHNVLLFKKHYPETAEKVLPKLWILSISGLAIGVGLLLL